jgi:hypothetical protein
MLLEDLVYLQKLKLEYGGVHHTGTIYVIRCMLKNKCVNYLKFFAIRICTIVQVHILASARQICIWELEPKVPFLFI